MIENLEQLYYDQLKDLHSAETQMLEALPEMVREATSPELKEAFQSHLQETREQKDRLERICAAHGVDPGGETCDAMTGLIKEARKHGTETCAGEVRDAVLIAAANRIEHYEIAGYGVARSFARVLGFDEDADTLETSLKEEGDADEKLTKLATGGLFSSGVNEAALS